VNARAAERFYEKLGDRTRRYGERPLDPNRRIVLKADPAVLRTKPGQAAMVVAGELLSRMVRSIVLDFEDIAFLPQFAGSLTGSLQHYMLERMRAVAPFGEFVAGSAEGRDYVLSIGDGGGGWLITGSDWDAYIGSAPSPLPAATTDNIFGSCLAVMTAVARVFAGPFPDEINAARANLFSFTSERPDVTAFAPAGAHLGRLWFAGAGSVGSAAAYFLALAGYRFEATLFDMDIVKTENLDRSPVFLFADVGKPKVRSVARFLRRFGIPAVGHPHALDEAPAWRKRPPGTPDLLISAANERDVRFEIETQLPPIQIYGTTGKDWQANMFHHVPPAPCSCCAFPGKRSVTDCAKGGAPIPGLDVKEVDAALPFLSFAAGLMTAAEISKVSLPGYPFVGNRGFFTPLAEEILFVRAIGHRPGCHCLGRSRLAHGKMINDSRYTRLSEL
jgi:hypothetical protein